MKQAKTVLTVALVLLMLLSMAACGPADPGESNAGPDNENNSATTTTVADDFWGDGDKTTTGSQPAGGEDPDPSGSSSTTKGAGGESVKTTVKVTTTTRATLDNFVFPKLSFKNKTVRVMTTSDVAAPKYVKDKLKSQYGLTLQEEYVGWSEIPTKLSAAVLGNQAPDLVRYRSDNPDMPSFIVKNLVQPIDEFVDLNNVIYKDLAGYYEQTKWNDKHYLLIDDITNGSFVFYNKKLFNDYNVEDPWELYKAGKWDWDKFASLSVKFKDDTDKDGEQDRYGFTLNVPPSALLYTTGEAFGTLDNKNQTITNNIKSANIARGMSLLHDLCFTKKGGANVIATGAELFANSVAAMTISECMSIAEMTNQTAYTNLAKKGNLGIVPVPKDPKADSNYYLCRLTGWFIPRTAANPQGAIAYNAVKRFYAADSATIKSMESDLKKAGYSDLNIEQLYANWNYGKAVFEFCPFIGYNSVWLSLMEKTPWATQIAQDAPTVQATIDDIFTKEVEQPTGPKVVENFEKYGTSTTKAINKYSPFVGGSDQIEIFLDKKSGPYQGKYNGRIDYTITGDNTFAALSRTLNSSWLGNNRMTFWAKSDGKGTQMMQVQVRCGSAPFACNVEVTDEGKEFSLKLSDFKLADWYPDQTAKMDLSNISSIVFNFEGKKNEKRSVYIDMIEVVE